MFKPIAVARFEHLVIKDFDGQFEFKVPRDVYKLLPKKKKGISWLTLNADGLITLIYSTKADAEKDIFNYFLDSIKTMPYEEELPEMFTEWDEKRCCVFFPFDFTFDVYLPSVDSLKRFIEQAKKFFKLE